MVVVGIEGVNKGLLDLEVAVRSDRVGLPLGSRFDAGAGAGAGAGAEGGADNSKSKLSRSGRIGAGPV